VNQLLMPKAAAMKQRSVPSAWTCLLRRKLEYQTAVITLSAVPALKSGRR
jgi:hypothetical protein